MFGLNEHEYFYLIKSVMYYHKLQNDYFRQQYFL